MVAAKSSPRLQSVPICQDTANRRLIAPNTGEIMHFEAPLSDDMLELAAVVQGKLGRAALLNPDLK
jgi:hypothetical protein